jgi:hypothetical protein
MGYVQNSVVDYGSLHAKSAQHTMSPTLILMKFVSHGITNYD